MLPQARLENRAVPQFNINGYQWIEAIINVVKGTGDPVIIAVTDRNVERLGGYSYIVKLIKFMLEEKNVSSPVAIHLDHGQTTDNVMKAIDAGFSSVMYDGSHEPLEVNIANTKLVTDYAKQYNVTVEGEIGGIGGVEDGMVGGVRYADPDECQRLVAETGLDALAPALGSVHGVYVGDPNLQFETMEVINNRLDIPLVLHGASGLSVEDIHQAISLGHAKINFNTELNQAWTRELRKILADQPNTYDPKDILTASKFGLEQEIKIKLDICNKRV